MQNGLSDDIFTSLQGQPLQRMSRELGIGPAQVAGAVSAALPMLLSALARNAQQPATARPLVEALAQDHSGLDIGDLIEAVTGGGRAAPAAASGDSVTRMLGHILGMRQQPATRALGTATGLSSDKTGALLRMLAPIVMSYLGRRFFSGQAARAAGDSHIQLGDVLGQERQRIGSQGGLGGALGGILDSDGDGDTDFIDLMRAGSSILGSAR